MAGEQGWNIRLKPGEQVSSPVIVLRARPYRESDLIVHMLTPALGKISAIARHARSSKKRFPNSLDVFDRGTARLVTERSGSLGIGEFTTAHSLMKVRQDLDKLTLASLVCETFDLVLQEHDRGSSGELFEVLDLSLNAIDEATELRGALRATFIAIAALCRCAGILDLSTTTPGSRPLNTLLDAVERFCERPLSSRNALKGVLKRLPSSTLPQQGKEESSQ